MSIELYYILSWKLSYLLWHSQKWKFSYFYYSTISDIPKEIYYCTVCNYFIYFLVSLFFCSFLLWLLLLCLFVCLIFLSFLWLAYIFSNSIQVFFLGYSGHSGPRSFKSGLSNAQYGAVRRALSCSAFIKIFDLKNKVKIAK